jgi:hypothetical protein
MELMEVPMVLSPKTKVLSLTEEYPFLVDFLAEYSPKLAGFRNPVLRKTFGRAASLGKVAAMGGLPLDKLVIDIRGKIASETGSELEVDLASMPMSREERRVVLEGFVRDLHDGKDVENVKRRFKEIVEDVSPTEISEMEQSLINAGMPIENITHLCDAHAAIFKDALSEYELPSMPSGHPVHTYRAENEAIARVCDELDALLTELGDTPSNVDFARNAGVITEVFEQLCLIELHYQRKEYQLFPFLERAGVTGPPKVMWGVHDEIRAMLKGARAALVSRDAGAFAARARDAMTAVREMAFKEHFIMLPMALELLKEADWLEMRRGEDAIGYALVKPGTDWPTVEMIKGHLSAGSTAQVQPDTAHYAHDGRASIDYAYAQTAGEDYADASNAGADFASAGGGAGFATVMLNFQTGVLTPEQANLLFNHLPVEISFTDENHIVRYYSEGKERIFPRSPGVIGRHVENCHPPKSLHMVRAILDAFVKGERDVSEFWIEFQGKFVYIRYFAIRDAAGRFRGAMEVVQDVTRIRSLEGERRLFDWE